MTEAQADALIAALNNLATILANIFTVPDASTLSQAFGLGLMVPLTLYVVAFYVGSLVNFWKK